MPLLRIQAGILAILAVSRNPQSFVAGATPLNRGGPRTSEDIDIFHDRADGLLQVADADAVMLESRGYKVEWQRHREEICTATISDDEQATRLDWVVDSDFRFFPPAPSEVFGYVLHPMDIATNKALAAAGRREPRDAVDLITIHERFYPLGAVIWAAVAKDRGWSPESLIAEIRRSARYQDDDLAGLDMEPSMTAGALSNKLRAALNDAEAFVSRMPSEKAGLIFFDDNNRIVQPDPDRLERYGVHAGSRGGHWPSSADITSAMLDAWAEPYPPAVKS